MTDLRKTAVYIRLSAEDDNVDGRAKKESDSVTSQRILLKSFVIDQLGVDEADILEYVDDGVSGTHFKRQGFQQLQIIGCRKKLADQADAPGLCMQIE